MQQYGLQDVMVEENGTSVSKVRLACAKEHEQCAYVQDEVYFEVVERIVATDQTLPVHYIFGDRFDVMYVIYLLRRTQPW